MDLKTHTSTDNLCNLFAEVMFQNVTLPKQRAWLYNTQIDTNKFEYIVIRNIIKINAIKTPHRVYRRYFNVILIIFTIYYKKINK